jgi:putative DNA primase/helicase
MSRDRIGGNKPTKGLLPELDFLKDGRAVGIIFDANSRTNGDVRRARSALARRLQKQGANVMVFDLPIVGNVNGVDDLIGLSEKAFTDLLSHGVPVPFEPLPADVGNADLVLEHLDRRALYCKALKEWFLADETERWSLDRTNRIAAIIECVMRERWLELASSEKPPKGKLKHALSSLDWHSLRDCLAVLQCQQEIVALPEDLDSDAMLLGVENGILNLRTGELVPPRLDLLVTRCAPVRFDAAAKCDAFLEYLERVQPDQENRAFLQRLCGSLLTGLQPEQSIVFFHGVGANGKSVFIRILTDVLGPDYCFKARKQLLFVSGRRSEHGPNDVADLVGKRLITTTEQSGKTWNIEFLKDFTGGELQHGRQLYKVGINFKPTGKIVVSANQKPTLTEFDIAVQRRFICLPWPVVIPESERVVPLEFYVASLLSNGGASGFLNWCLLGLQDLVQHGWRLDPPESAMEATKEYIKQEDLIGRFFAEWFEYCDPSEMREPFTTKELRKHFALWSDTPDKFLISPKKFTQECKRLFGERCQLAHANRFVVDGLRFNDKGAAEETELRREQRSRTDLGGSEQ